jgi:hypothetical protein
MMTLLAAKGLGILIGCAMVAAAIVANDDARCGLAVVIRRAVRRVL